MRRYFTYTFPAGNKTDVCKLQSTAGGGNLILNGNLINSTASGVDFLSQGHSRSASITSINNLSGINFTIKGKQNGADVVEVLAGPNNSTVYGTKIFDVITSISTSGAAAAVSIGTGHSGYFPLIYIDLERDIINYSLSTFKLTAASIPTVILNTLEDISTSGKPLVDTVKDNAFQIKASSADNQYILPPANVIPCHSIIVLIPGSAVTIDNSIRMNFIQV